MAEPELEEGEACRHKDDTSIDPDIALSYIDEKLQNVLGHFQKYFEGGVCAENLGAKFSGYGSFLPMHHRSPSVQSHPKTPQRSQNNSTPKSPNNFHLEGVPQKSLVPSGVPLPSKHRTTSPGMHLLHDPKVASTNGLVKTDSCLLPGKAGAKVPVKQEPSLTKSVEPTDHKTPIELKWVLIKQHRKWLQFILVLVSLLHLLQWGTAPRKVVGSLSNLKTL